MGRLFKRFAPYKSILFEVLLINIVMGILALTSPFLIQILTDDVLIRGNELLEYRQGKTTILINHRPSVNRRVDEIIYLEESQLKLQGSLPDVLQIQGEHLKFLE